MLCGAGVDSCRSWLMSWVCWFLCWCALVVGCAGDDGVGACGCLVGLVCAGLGVGRRFCVVLVLSDWRRFSFVVSFGVGLGC